MNIIVISMNVCCYPFVLVLNFQAHYSSLNFANIYIYNATTTVPNFDMSAETEVHKFLTQIFSSLRAIGGARVESHPFF